MIATSRDAWRGAEKGLPAVASIRFVTAEAKGSTVVGLDERPAVISRSGGWNDEVGRGGRGVTVRKGLL